uniref:Uncharacterized protein n=1 Tax=Sphaerodactylus townsendi TaxID=933632 RepID=A0ACB8ECC5_9SAUR
MQQAALGCTWRISAKRRATKGAAAASEPKDGKPERRAMSKASPVRLIRSIPARPTRFLNSFPAPPPEVQPVKKKSIERNWTVLVNLIGKAEILWNELWVCH